MSNIRGEEYIVPELFDATITTWSPGYETGDKLVNMAELLVWVEGVMANPFLVKAYVTVPSPPDQDKEKPVELIEVADRPIGFVGCMERLTSKEDVLTFWALVPVILI
jgi:hypothetical protein